jgi:ATP synthase protein I
MTTARVTSGSTARLHRPATVGGQVRATLLVTAGLGLVGTVLGALVGGSPAAVGAAVGFAMVLVFFGTGAVVVNAVASVSPAASMLVALLTYTLQVVLVGVVFAALDRSGALDGPVDRAWAGGAVVVATLVWLVSHIRAATRSRQPLYDLPERPSEGPEASAR